MIDLTETEQALLSEIELEALSLTDHVHTKRNGELATSLIKELVARGGIPEHRLKYFTDPAYNAGGRGASRHDEFERNGCRGDEINRHPHFLKYLRYFIHGPDLPESVISAFHDKVKACGHVTSGDIIPLGKAARELARSAGLTGREARDEFFKLALECGLGTSIGAAIRQAVSRV